MSVQYSDTPRGALKRAEMAGKIMPDMSVAESLLEAGPAEPRPKPKAKKKSKKKTG